uniref:cytoplasmic polyadenylation element-binding protein 1-like n=1 Tax=Myxine glutinosa TaxID=7769 RepID=UPI0035901E6C
MNTLLGNTLDLHGVCLTPPARRTPERRGGGREPRPTRGEPPVVAHLGALFAQKLLLESKSCESKTHQNLPYKIAQTFMENTSCYATTQAMNNTETTPAAELDIIRLHRPTVRRSSMKDSGMRLVHRETLLFADVSNLLTRTFTYGDEEESYGVQISSEVLERSGTENTAYPGIVPCDINEDEVKEPVPVEHSSCSSAAPIAADRKTTLKWKGNLSFYPHAYCVYSCKVFIGGIPWTITEAQLLNKLHKFGSLTVEWPNKDKSRGSNISRGYAYMVFRSESGVWMLLNACSCKEDSLGQKRFLYKLMLASGYLKQVEVIPWVLADNKWELDGATQLKEKRMVFVGALHGLITACHLSSIMNDLFGGVISVGIDIDKHKYPIGSGRVTFGNRESYMEAVTAAFVEIKTKRFSKKVQIDPYLEDALCSMCSTNPGALFCREMVCFRYFCKTCWTLYHCKIEASCHQPLERTPRSNTGR